MSVQTTQASLRNYKNDLQSDKQMHSAGKESNNRLSIFISRYNPFNWFNEFRDIKITLEEFSADKNKHC